MADSDMLKAAEAEVKRLEAELAATPAYKKLQLAKQVVDLYRSESAPKPSAHIRRPDPIGLGVQYFQELGTKTARIEAAAVNYLKKKGSRATSGELLNAMTAAGIVIGGAEPNKALSSYLSNSKALNNVRELGGYGLQEWGHGKGPDLLTETGA